MARTQATRPGTPGLVPWPPCYPNHHARRSGGGHTPQEPAVMRDDPVVTGLVTRARHGDQHAWTPTPSVTRRWCGPSAAATGSAAPTPTTSARPSGYTCWPTSANSATRPRWLAGSLPRPGANAARPAGPPGQRGPPRGKPIPATSPTPPPSRPSPGCWRPSATRRCARRSPARPPAASSCSRAHRRPADPPRPDQRPARHRRREHRAHPPPLPAQAAPPPGHRRPDLRRTPSHRT
jgi:hypothetical protein